MSAEKSSFGRCNARHLLQADDAEPYFLVGLGFLQTESRYVHMYAFTRFLACSLLRIACRSVVELLRGVVSQRFVRMLPSLAAE